MIYQLGIEQVGMVCGTLSSTTGIWAQRSQVRCKTSIRIGGVVGNLGSAHRPHGADRGGFIGGDARAQEVRDRNGCSDQHDTGVHGGTRY